MPEIDDKKIWAAYAQTVKPISGKKKMGKPQASAPKPLSRAVGEGAARSTAGEGKVAKPPISFDRRTERRLREGAIEIDARLDLHGMRQDEAYGALNAFIARQIKAGHRCLLIITGKGRAGTGVLRTKLADWLAASQHAAQILALRPAALRHGGAGAFYVILKKGKSRDE